MRNLRLISTFTSTGEIRLELEEVPLPALASDEVILQIMAAPINPSDIGLMLGPSDVKQAKVEQNGLRPALTAPVPSNAKSQLAGRLDQPLTIGNEGAGFIVDAGDEYRHLIGTAAAAMPGGMFAQYRVLKASACMLLPAGTDPVDAAAAFVNPLTAQAMIETMRLDGHRALVHNAAASNLGQMLVRACRAEDVPLVNIVRSEAQVALLREQGAQYVCDSSGDQFEEELEQALSITGATIAFDPVGAKMPSTILSAMERVLNRGSAAYSRYGSATHKQVYLYGTLDMGAVTIERDIGMAWSIGGWLTSHYFARVGKSAEDRLRSTVAEHLTDRFRSDYAGTLTLEDFLDPGTVSRFAGRKTGAKMLLRPNTPPTK